MRPVATRREPAVLPAPPAPCFWRTKYTAGRLIAACACLCLRNKRPLTRLHHSVTEPFISSKHDGLTRYGSVHIPAEQVVTDEARLPPLFHRRCRRAIPRYDRGIGVFHRVVYTPTRAQGCGSHLGVCQVRSMCRAANNRNGARCYGVFGVPRRTETTW